MTDPPTTPTALCPVCGNERGRTIPKTASKAAKAHLRTLLEADPFDSVLCAREWWGVPIVGQPDKASDPDLAFTAEPSDSGSALYGSR